ncbi:J domain-containing protein [Hyphomicrobium sp. 2TAF46]|uniref:J domain-containing protein n=1 Tax=Hyphomicrobium sp. 2TAF46 TaxID=3233019 RepID=UPI003F8FB18D
MTRNQNHALKAALDLLRIPSQVRLMRLAPLPPGVLLLLRLAAAESDAECEAEKLNLRGPSAHRDAAIFFIEQVLLSSNSDAYRVLGLDATATVSELRRHMAYLLKWLHPDLSRDPHKERLAQRVLVAWNEVKAAKRLDGVPQNGAHESLRKPANGGYRAPAIARRRSAADRQGEARALRSRLARRLRRRVRPL